MEKDTTGKSREKVARWLQDMLPRKCCNCGSTKGIQYHHIVPAIYGGNDVPSNIAVLCSDCHSKVHYGKGGVINHADSVKRGLEIARKERGVVPGRKPYNGEKIMRAISEQSTQFNLNSLTTEHEIMATLGVKEVCYSKYKRQLIDAMSAEEWPYSWPKPEQVRNRPMYDRQIKRLRGDI